MLALALHAYEVLLLDFNMQDGLLFAGCQMFVLKLLKGLVKMIVRMQTKQKLFCVVLNSFSTGVGILSIQNV